MIVAISTVTAQRVILFRIYLEWLQSAQTEILPYLDYILGHFENRMSDSEEPQNRQNLQHSCLSMMWIVTESPCLLVS